MKNKDKGKNKAKLKYIGVVVVVVFLAGIYLASATTVITDIQMTLEKVGVGTTKIGGGVIEVDDSSGSPIFCVNSTSGNVGIGTAEPQGLLQVGEESFTVTDDNWVGINDVTPDAKLEVSVDGQPTPDLFMLSSNDNKDGDRFIVKNNGNVGIGTLNPLADLHIKNGTPEVRIDATNGAGFARLHLDSEGEAQLFLDSNNQNEGFIQFAQNWGAKWRIKYNPLDEKLTFERFPYVSNPPVITLTQDRKVGIGTTDPDEELHVHKPQNAPTMIHVTNGNNGANAKAGIKLDNSEIFVQHGLGTPYPNSLVIHHNEQNEQIKFIINSHEMMRLQSSPTPPRVCINDVLHLEPRASAPLGPLEGDIYVDSGNNHIYCYLNGGWKQLDN